MHVTSLLLAALPLLAPSAEARAHTARAGAHHAAAREVREALVAREASAAKAHLGFPPSSGIDGVIHKRDPAGAKAHLGFPPSSGVDGVVHKRDPAGAKAHLGFPPASGVDGVVHKRGAQKRIRKRKTTCAAKSAKSSAAAASAAASASSSLTGAGLHASPSTATSAHATSTASVSPYSSVSSGSYHASATSSAVWESATSSPAWESTASAVSSAVSAASSVYPSGGASTVSASSAPSASSSSSSGSSSLFARYFPTGDGTSRWSTFISWPGALSFKSALTPLTSGKLPSESTAPDGSDALVANYPAGTFKYSSSTGHGYSFYSPGSADSVDITGAKEAVFSYSVYFPSGFQFVKGGKLPGLYGGSSLETAKSCSGGRQDDRDDCFSARLMWRADGAGEIYNYLPPDLWTDSYCDTAPYSKCDASYGESIGRGSFSFATGDWTTVAIRLKLNDYGSANGEQELFVNGVSTLKLTGLSIVANADTKIYGIMAQTFFGGSDSSWASPTDQSAYFKDWSLAVLA